MVFRNFKTFTDFHKIQVTDGSMIHPAATLGHQYTTIQRKDTRFSDTIKTDDDDCGHNDDKDEDDILRRLSCV